MSRPHVAAIAKLMRANAGAHRLDEVFADSVEMMALAISNAIDLAQAEAREARYLELARRYSAEELGHVPQMLALLVQALEEGPTDVLGAVFGELEQGNSARGQFFTPYHVCRMMAQLVVGDGTELRARIRERGFITAQEPAAGAGAQVIALAEALQDLGFNYQERLHVTAVDVDPRTVHMAYVQLSLLHIPALVIVGNTIAREQREVWRTPAHVLGLWDNKLARGYALGSEADRSGLAPLPEVVPMPAALPALAGEPAQLDLFGVPA